MYLESTYTEEEIDRTREAAMQFFRDTYGLDSTNIEPNRNREPWGMQQLNLLCFHSTLKAGWLMEEQGKVFSDRERWQCTIMLHGEYGGDKLALESDCLSTDINILMKLASNREFPTRITCSISCIRC